MEEAGKGAPSVSLRELPLAELGTRGFLQSAFWGRFKEKAGWKARAFSFALEEGEGSFLLLEKRMKGRMLAYVPHGPEFDPAPSRPGDAAARTRFLAKLGAALVPFLGKDCLCVRFDPPWFERGAERFPAPLAPPLRKARADGQPPDTVLVDLGRTEEDILGAMKPKWRYNVKLAEKKGVEVERWDAASGEWRAGLEAWYAMYLDTARRDGIEIHSRNYYASLFESAEAEGADLRLYLARAEGELIAGNVVLVAGEGATYLYGASSNEKRNLMPTYSLQWRAIRDSKGAGALVYDMFGMPPRDDPSHPMHGLYRFKTGFGGDVVHRQGSWDYPLSRAAYAAAGAYESLRMLWHKRIKKAIARARRKRAAAE